MSEEKTTYPVKLKKCPFCGKGFRINALGAYEHDNEGCILHGFEICNYKDVKAWNTRKPIDDIVERLEKELKFADEEKERCAKENSLMFDNAKGYSTGISNAIEIVKDIAGKDTNVATNNGWIPCEVRLPEDACWAITCDHEGNIHIFFYSGGFFRESWGGRPIKENHDRFYVPIAWQPLPAPYKKGE